jgi:nucleoside-diphosphate-sugar epimerase
MKLFVFGLGYTAREFVARHGQSFDAIYATVRTAEQAAELRNANLTTFVFGKDEEDVFIDAALADSDIMLISVPPGDSADPVLARYGRRIDALRHKMKILYFSTVGVYGDRAGEWVNEERLPTPKGGRATARLRVEKALLAMARDGTKTVHILRLAGIYGARRNALATLAAGTARRVVKPGQVFNRIHVADICAVMEALLHYEGGSAIWNVSDDEPAPPQDVVTYAAMLLGIDPPPEQSVERADLSPLARSFYNENKRASNDKIKQTLGIRLSFPTYREGLTALHEAGEGQR